MRLATDRRTKRVYRTQVFCQERAGETVIPDGNTFGHGGMVLQARDKLCKLFRREFFQFPRYPENLRLERFDADVAAMATAGPAVEFFPLPHFRRNDLIHALLQFRDECNGERQLAIGAQLVQGDASANIRSRKPPVPPR